MGRPKGSKNKKCRIEDQGRECSRCGVFGGWEKFYAMPRGAHGYSSQCKACAAEIAAARYQANRTAEPVKKRVDALGQECSKCGTYKAFAEFSKDKHSSNGWSSACLVCRNRQFKAWAEAHPDKLKASVQRWIEKNIDFVRSRARESSRAWRAARDRDELNKAQRAYRQSRPEQFREYEVRSYAQHKDRLLHAQRLDRQTRPWLYCAYDAKKRAKRKKAYCAWADQSAIKAVYIVAKKLRNAGVDCHVDHIVPLVSSVVQGLHVESNLRIVFAQDNLKKSNRFDPDSFNPHDVPCIHWEDIKGVASSEGVPEDVAEFADMLESAATKTNSIRVYTL